jgi:hypothetical protein
MDKKQEAEFYRRTGDGPISFPSRIDFGVKRQPPPEEQSHEPSKITRRSRRPGTE